MKTDIHNRNTHPTTVWKRLLLLATVAMCSSPLPAQEHQDEHQHPEASDGHEDHNEDAVLLDPAVLKEFDVQTGKVGPGTIYEEIVLPGEIKYNREAIAYATPRYPGTVRTIKVRLADRVTEGQVLATLESTETLRPFDIVAPFDGIVVGYDITPGQTVDAGAALLTIADLSTVWADLQIYQRNINQVREGQSVLIEGNHDLPGYRGTVAYVAPTIDEHTRTGLARVIVDNPDRIWKPGYFIKGSIAVDTHRATIAIPRTALLSRQGRTVVFVRTDSGFVPQPVVLGKKDSRLVEILHGLQPGDTIALKNAISLKAEMGKGSFGGHKH